MIGDKQPADANVRVVQAPPGFLGGQKIKTCRYTYCIHDPFKPDSPLRSSCLLGPVQLLTESRGSDSNLKSSCKPHTNPKKIKSCVLTYHESQSSH
jgi:hypothetical protein